MRFMDIQNAALRQGQQVASYSGTKEWLSWSSEAMSELLKYCSQRQIQVARLVRLGKSDGEIATALGVTPVRIGQLRKRIGQHAQKLVSGRQSPGNVSSLHES